MKDIKGVNMQEKIGKNLLAVFLFICLAILTYLTVFHFLYSYINTFEAYDIENPSLIKDSIIENLLCIASGVLVSFGLIRLFKERTILCNIFIYVLATIAMVVSIIWVLKSGIIPNYDPASICAAAVAFNKGDYSLLEKGQYVAIWPNQLGIISILRFVFLLCGENNYLAFQIVNAVSVFFIILLVSKITQALTGDNGAAILSLVLCVTCIPLYFYTTWVYGDLISIAFMLTAILCFIKLCEHCTSIGLVTLSLSIALSIMAKQNSEILVVAMIGILLFKIVFCDRRKECMLIMAAVIVGLLLEVAIINLLYSNHMVAGVDAMPVLCWVAMGTNIQTNEIGEYAGWWNRASIDLFMTADYNSDEASRLASIMIDGFIEKCKEDPQFALHFYNNKISTQWCTAMFEALKIAVDGVTEESFAYSIIMNYRTWNASELIMKFSQLFVYFGGVLFAFLSWLHIDKVAGSDSKCIYSCFSGIDKIEKYVGLITIVGGFIFSMLWESKARYIFPYYILLIPYTTAGIFYLIRLKGGFKRN